MQRSKGIISAIGRMTSILLLAGSIAAPACWSASETDSANSSFKSLSSKPQAAHIPYNPRQRIYTVPPSALQQFREDPEYDYRERKPVKTFWEEIKEWIFQTIFRSITKNIRADIFEKIIYILAFFFVLLLGYFYYKYGANSLFAKKRKSDRAQIEGEIHQDIEQADLEGALHRAEQNADYRMALRYHYLILLRSMHRHGIIQWQPDKTNKDYLRETKQHMLLYPVFTHSTRLFEMAWYGGWQPEAAEYTLAAQTIKQCMLPEQGNEK
jgi:hypothetical protein